MSRKNKIQITKASGEITEFSEEKIRNSLKRTGTGEHLINKVIKGVLPKLYPGITTKKIYKIAFALLKSNSRHIAGKYHLKHGIMELGPSGYPFEYYIGELMKSEGYEVKTNEIVAGKCVAHEIDVIALKGNDHYMIECKYHNQPGNVTDVKVPLYIKSRFMDVKATWINIDGHASKFHQGRVVTNTRFTTDAIQYGNCAGLKLISWDYPKKESLREMIDSSGLYPITCLTSISKKEKAHLLNKKIVLCKELCKSERVLQQMGIKSSRIQTILNEGELICKNIGLNAQH